MKIDIEKVHRHAREALNDDLEWDPGHGLVIALCDRIRDLEDALRSLIDLEPEPSVGAWQDSKEVLEKGAVMP